MGNRTVRTAILTILVCWITGTVIGWSQTAATSNLDPKSSTPRVPVVVFDLAWAGAQPAHYMIAVDSTGSAAYRSDDTPPSGQEAGDPYILKFVVTDPSRTKIFELAKEANYFKGNFDYTKTRVAQTGTKTLTYMEGNIAESFDQPVRGKDNQTTYNWSQNSAIQQLTTLFQDMSYTFELGRRLDFKRRFDKLGLDAELKNAEQAQKDGTLQQMQVIAPVLKNIANDTSVMHVARERAKRLLTVAEESSAK